MSQWCEFGSMDRLTIVAADLSGSEADLRAVFDQWAEADLYDAVALVDLNDHDQGLDRDVRWLRRGACQTMSLREVLTRERFSAVTLASIRAGLLRDYAESRFAAEISLLRIVEPRFVTLKVRTVTVAVADPDDCCNSQHFDPQWDLHILHDPHLIADSSVAVVPLEPEHRAPVCLMTALAVTGALTLPRSASGYLVDQIVDQAVGLTKPVRLARVQLRVLDAGFYVDQVIAGALPESGPWMAPADFEAVEAPFGSPVPGHVAKQFVEAADMAYIPYIPLPRPRSKEISIFDGLRLFVKHFWSIVKVSPMGVLERTRSSVDDRVATAVQPLTFGEQSAYQLRYRPHRLPTDTDSLLQSLTSADLADDTPSVNPDPQSWEKLRATAFGLVDGGALPSGVQRPSGDVSSLVYADPVTIGPPPDDPGFEMSADLAEKLGFDEALHVGPMDVFTAGAVGAALERSSDLSSLDELKGPWAEWIKARDRSFLWQVGHRLAQDIDAVQKDLSGAGADALAEEKNLSKSIEKTRGLLHRWARWWVGLALVILAVIIAWPSMNISSGLRTAPSGLQDQPWDVYAVVGVILLLLLTVRLTILTRDHARILQARDDQFYTKNAEARFEHCAKELARMVSIRDQFNDWQAIIRSVVHVPFVPMDSAGNGSEPRTVQKRPQSFVYAMANPKPQQLHTAQRIARDRVMHTGWLSEVFRALQSEWEESYLPGQRQKWLSPERDNSAPGMVRARSIEGNEPIAAPREDFRRRMQANELSRANVVFYSDAIKELLDRTDVDDLLSEVQASGPGQALSGMSPGEFLFGLAEPIEEVPIFDPSLFGPDPKVAPMRLDNVARSFPKVSDSDGAKNLMGRSVAALGHELRFAFVRVVVSDAVDPELLSFYDHENRSPDPVDRAKPAELIV